MTQTLWPVIWPTDIQELDPEKVDAAERFAAAAMHHLTGRRVGHVAVTVMPCTRQCKCPGDFGAPFHPVLMDSGRIANCFCQSGCSCDSAPRVMLDAPVGGIIRVISNGEEIPATSYEVQDGRWLVRTDGEGWPSCAGADFTVTYWNSHLPSKMGQMAAGYLAAEYLKLLDNDKKCRLPAGVTSISRAGVNIEIETGMFPGGVTGLREVDTYIMMWNPYALKTPPTIHSIDKKRNRQVTWKGI